MNYVNFVFSLNNAYFLGMESFSSYYNSLQVSLYTFHFFYRFYYNKRTKVSSWEKPLELMTPIEVSHTIDFALMLLYKSLVVPLDLLFFGFLVKVAACAYLFWSVQY